MYQGTDYVMLFALVGSAILVVTAISCWAIGWAQSDRKFTTWAKWSLYGACIFFIIAMAEFQRTFQTAW